jgi:hypothetical protein
MTVNTSKLQTPKKLPKLEILFSTAVGDENEENSVANSKLPILTVVYDEEKYSIVQGGELIDDGLAESFQNLENDFYTVRLAFVDLRQVEANSRMIN